MFFIRSHLPMTPMNHEKLHGICFVQTVWRNPEDRHTHRQMRQLYNIYM